MGGEQSVLATFGRAWRNILAAGPRRLTITALALGVALIVARLAWQIPFIGEAELAFYDFRAFYAASGKPVEQDPRILLVVYDDDTLIATRKRSPLDRALLARALGEMDRMGAKAIGIDILIDQPQDEDGQLIAALKAMKTPTFLAFAAEATNKANINYNQQQYLEQFLAQLKGTNVHPASVRMTTDNDGVRRAWEVPPAHLPPPLVSAMARAAGENIAAFDGFDGAIRFRLPADPERGVFQKLKIDLYADPAIAGALASQVAGRYILVGGDISDIDQIETPLTRFERRTIPGLEMHAHMLAQLLDRDRPARWSSVALWAIAALVVLAAALTSMIEAHWLRVIPFIAAQFALFVGLPMIAQTMGQDTYGMPAVGWVAAWVIAYSSAGSAVRAVGADQRRFAQSALGKYLPRDIAQQIIVRPELLSLHGEKREIFALFSDLEGFTKLSHAIQPEMVATLLNRYLDTLSAVVLAHGGVIDKFVGDAVVAFWGAPIARPDDGANAARAAYAMWQAGEVFRRNVPPGVPPIGKTRVGLHFGEAIVGNFGGEGRIQYTALGDSMNTAARLESANKALGSSVLASREAMERSALDWWRPMGTVVLRGRATPVEIFEPAPEFPREERTRLEKLLAMPLRQREERLSGLEALVRDHPGDEALAYLLVRETTCRNGEAYELA
jgi:adenylate cyclase